MKWCSESDVSVLELEPSQNERYDDCYAYDDFDLDFDLDTDLALTRQPVSRRRRATETVDLYADRSQLRQLQAPAVLRHKSQSTESFFEQPNEEGSLYMYGGRKRIAVKAPSAANIYDRVRGSTDSDRDRERERERERERVRERGGPYGILSPNRSRKTPPQLPAPSWRGGKRQEQAQNADKRRYDNATGNSNITNSNNNNTNNNIQHKRQLTNAKQDNEDMLKNKNYFNSKNKSIATAAATKAAAAAKATATASETAAQTSGGGGGKTSAAAGVGGGAAVAAGGVVGPTMSNSPGQTNNAPPPPPPSGTRTGRSTSRLDISDMESIYGYLKPRKPRSLSLKKIQILDY